MLKNTFCHIPKIGIKKEQHLWEKGLTSWDKFYKNDFKLSLTQTRILENHINRSKLKLKNRNIKYFYDRLPEEEQWRVFKDFRKDAVYLDIEAAGQKAPNDYISTISLYDGENIFCYVHGKNLNDFCEDIKKYKLIITYSGKSFDVPYLEKYFNIKLDHAHIDLRYILRDLGYTGGLKGCEKTLGISRNELDGVNGYFAVILWREYNKRGNKKALNTLLAYNIKDVVNLETLMIIAYNLKIKEIPIRKKSIKMNKTPKIPYKADIKTIERLKKRMYYRK